MTQSDHTNPGRPPTGDHSGADDHDHGGGQSGHDHGPAGMRGLQRRALWIALILNAGYLGVEVVGGLAFGSLALLADAAHMVSDVAALIIALIAQTLAGRPATSKHSYGLARTEVLAALLNGVALVIVALWIVYEAIGRIGEPADVQGAGLLVVATLGLLVNLVSAIMLARAQGDSLNMRGAFLHMATDAAGSIAAMIAGVAIIVWQAEWVDPAVSILIAILVLWSVWSLLRDTTNVLLEGTPRGIDPDKVTTVLTGEPSVAEVHHLHLWNLASDQPALSAHLVLDGVETLHDAQVEGDRLKALLGERFAIHHATLELECHGCEIDHDHDLEPAAHTPLH